MIKLSDYELLVEKELRSLNSLWTSKKPGKEAPISTSLKHLCGVFPNRTKLISLSAQAHEMCLTKYHGKPSSPTKSMLPILNLINSIPMRSRKLVVEIGCGNGSLLSELIKLNFFESGVGIEHPSMIGELREKANFPMHFFDLDSKISINSCFDLYAKNSFDLLICTEVAEHLTPESHQNLLEICNHFSSTILFSSPPAGNRSSGHISCRDPAYWIKKFQEFGFSSYKPPIGGRITGKQFFVFSKEKNITQLDSGYDFEFYAEQIVAGDGAFSNAMWKLLINNRFLNAVSNDELFEEAWRMMFLYPSTIRHLKYMSQNAKIMKLLENNIPDAFADVNFWLENKF